MVHVDEAGAGLGRVDPRPLDVPGRRVAHRVAAAAHAELAADRRQGQHRHRGVPTVAIPFEPPAAANQRRRAFRVQTGDLLERRRFDAGHARGSLEGPRFGALAQPLGAAGVLAEKILVGEAVREEKPVHGQSDGDVGAGFDREVDVGRPGERGGSRVNDDKCRAARLRLPQVWNQVNTRRAGIDPPQDDQRRLRVILVRDGGHLSVERHVRRAGRRRAHGPRQARRAKAPPDLRVDVVLREQAVRSAVRVGKDARPAPLGFGRDHLLGDEPERFVPRRARELALALSSLAHSRKEKSIRSVDVLVELADLCADEAVGHRVPARPVDLRHAPAPHGHRHAARIWTIERTRRFHLYGRGTNRFRTILRSNALAWRSHGSTDSILRFTVQGSRFTVRNTEL